MSTRQMAQRFSHMNQIDSSIHPSIFGQNRITGGELVTGPNGEISATPFQGGKGLFNRYSRLKADDLNAAVQQLLLEDALNRRANKEDVTERGNQERLTNSSKADDEVRKALLILKKYEADLGPQQQQAIRALTANATTEADWAASEEGKKATKAGLTGKAMKSAMEAANIGTTRIGAGEIASMPNPMDLTGMPGVGYGSSVNEKQYDTKFNPITGKNEQVLTQERSSTPGRIVRANLGNSVDPEPIAAKPIIPSLPDFNAAGIGSVPSLGYNNPQISTESGFSAGSISPRPSFAKAGLVERMFNNANQMPFMSGAQSDPENIVAGVGDVFTPRDSGEGFTNRQFTNPTRDKTAAILMDIIDRMFPKR